jgi:hypothetical protein
MSLTLLDLLPLNQDRDYHVKRRSQRNPSGSDPDIATYFPMRNKATDSRSGQGNLVAAMGHQTCRPPHLLCVNLNYPKLLIVLASNQHALYSSINETVWLAKGMVYEVSPSTYLTSSSKLHFFVVFAASHRLPYSMLLLYISLPAQ